MEYQSNLFLSCALIAGVSAIWLAFVAWEVSDPYLDEFFHVRQAANYWIGNWHVWDPKITTPPGLYVLSYGWLLLQGLVIYAATGRFTPGRDLPLIYQLRTINWVGINGIFTSAWSLLGGITSNELSSATQNAATEEDETDDETSEDPEVNSRFIGIARNIALFPPLFFFSGLYYTDVLSVLVVLLCYERFHEQSSIGVVLLGLVSLFFRQNNIFWCAIYLGGLEVLRTLRRNQARERLHAYSHIQLIINESWTKGEYFDPLVDDAGVEDYALCAVTVAVAAVANLPQLIPKIFPYITLLALFGGFVVWNGSVVLGDKSNHVASLHFPQMLYIWPYFTFFSSLAMLPHIFLRLQHISESRSPLKELARILPRPLVLLAFVALSTAAVHFNTIIHPFTLADNRHYTFYVFRILRLYPLLKYAAVPIYIACAWAGLIALGSPHGSSAPRQIRAQSTDKQDQPAVVNVTEVLRNTADLSQSGNRVSFVLVWLVSSALGLVTAPLVEPRYYILPWIMWRLHVPAPVVEEDDPIAATSAGLFAEAAPWMETTWALTVNLATMHIFIDWGFGWDQEPGAIQRFMW